MEKKLIVLIPIGLMLVLSLSGCVEEESVETLLAPQISSGDGFDIGVFWATLQLPNRRLCSRGY